MQNTGENTMKKEYYSINSLMNIGLNIISKILAKQMQKSIKNMPWTKMNLFWKFKDGLILENLLMWVNTLTDKHGYHKRGQKSTS